jgi:membrane fusion protein (multidrug efflux system)
MSTQASNPSRPEIEAAAPPPRARGRMMLLLAALVVAAAGLFLWLHYRYRVSTDDAQIQGHIGPVAPRVPGTVIEVDVNDNQIVHAGQVLFRLDPRDYQAALQQAQANLTAAKAEAAGARTNVPITTIATHGTLSEARAGLRQAQSAATLAQRQVAVAQADQRAAQAQLRQAQATAQNAATTARRYAQLVAKQEVSRLEYDQMRTAAREAAAAQAAAEAHVAAADQQVASAEASVQVARDRVAQAAASEQKAATAPQQVAVSRAQSQLAQARVAQAEAAVALAQLNLDYTTIVAPTSGQVGNKNVEIGQTFAPGQTALVVVPINRMWVIANYKETELADMHPGQTAEISVDAFGTTLRAVVNSIGPGTGAVFSLLPPENATGNYVKVVQRVPVKLTFVPGQDLSRLRPGLSVEATVFTNTK